MAANEQMIPIPGRLHSMASEGHVAGANEIYDDDLQRLQSDINADVKMMGASGSSHSKGLVPDTDATEGTTKYLREDGTWTVPPDTTYSNFGKSGASHSSGLVPDPGATSGNTRFLREDGGWATPVNYVTKLTGRFATADSYVEISGSKNGGFVIIRSTSTGNSTFTLIPFYIAFNKITIEGAGGQFSMERPTDDGDVRIYSSIISNYVIVYIEC